MSAVYVGLHNNQKVLFILYKEAKPTRIEEKEGIALLYDEDGLVGINLFDDALVTNLPLGLQVKLGLEVINAVNAHLLKAGVKELKSEDSGYEVMEVSQIEEHPLNEKLSIVTLKGKEGDYSTVTRYSNFAVGDKLVAAKDGTFLFDGTCFHKKVERNIPIEVSLCSEKDLHLGEDFKSAIIVNDKTVGEDYFA